MSTEPGGRRAVEAGAVAWVLAGELDDLAGWLLEICDEVEAIGRRDELLQLRGIGNRIEHVRDQLRKGAGHG